MQARNTISRGRNFKRIAAGIALLAASALSMLGPAGAVAQDDRSAWTLSCVDLAKMHIEYLLLDEVVAGRGPAVHADIDHAVAWLEYLLLPEVALDGSCRGHGSGS